MTADSKLTENSSGVCTQVGQNRVFPIKQETARFEVDLVPSRVVKLESKGQSPGETDQIKNLKSKTTSLCSEQVHSVKEP